MPSAKQLIKKPKAPIKKAKGKGIGIYISTDSTLEIVEYSFDSDIILNYVKTDMAYDPILREINIENFEAVFQKALQRFDVSSQTPISLTLPSIFINKKELPVELESEEVSTALVSEAEKNYIFKKSEPAVCWNVISKNKETQSVTVLYTALQKNIINLIEGVFRKQGLKLVSIDTSYASFIRGLAASCLIDEQIANNQNWHVFIIKHNTNAVITIQGNRVQNIIETPFAINSQEKDDLYPSLSSNLIENMQGGSSDAVVIANYVQNIDVDNLITYLNLKCPFIKIENNFYGKDPLYITNHTGNAESITPEVIGASYWKNAPIDFAFNFLQTPGYYDEVPEFLANLGVTGNPVHLFLIALIAISAAVIGFLSIISIPVNTTLTEQYKKLYIECDKYQNKFDKPQEKPFDLFDIVERDFKKNEKIVSSYDAISAVIPEKVWITSVSIDDSFNTDIFGRAYNIEDIVTYYKNLLSVTQFDSFKIKSIKVVGDSSGVPVEQEIPDVNINSGSQPLPEPISRQDRNSMLPPPPPSSTAIPSINPSSSISKYYEFNFGNAVAPAATPTQPAQPGQPSPPVPPAPVN